MAPEKVLRNEADKDVILVDVNCKLFVYNKEEKEWRDLGKGIHTHIMLICSHRCSCFVASIHCIICMSVHLFVCLWSVTLASSSVFHGFCGFFSCIHCIVAGISLYHVFCMYMMSYVTNLLCRPLPRDRGSRYEEATHGHAQWHGQNPAQRCLPQEFQGTNNKPVRSHNSTSSIMASGL